MNALLKTAAFLFASVLAIQVHARSFVLPDGMSLEPDSTLDLTYQVVPSLDEIEKLVVGWSGDKIQYAITVEKLPPGWLDSGEYFSRLVGDLRASGRTVDTGRRGDYKATSGLRGAFMEIRSRSATRTEVITQVGHFLTNGTVAFIAFATLLNKSSADRMLEESTLLFKSAAIVSTQLSEVPRRRAESPYFGTWQATSLAPTGQRVIADVVLKDDLSFTARVSSLDGRSVFSAVGVWSVNGKSMYWTYIRSVPPLPDDRKEDEDEIVLHSGDRLLLRSTTTGKEYEYIRK
jgi:hypothetical protein